MQRAGDGEELCCFPSKLDCRKDVWESDSNREENQKPLTKAGQSDVTLRLCELFT